MNKKLVLSVLIVVLVLPVVFAQSIGNLRNEAKVAGYHNVIYTNYIQDVNSTNMLYVYPQTVAFGWNAGGRYLLIQGDASGNYAIQPVFPGARLTLSSDVYTSGDVVMASGKVIRSTGNFVIRLS